MHILASRPVRKLTGSQSNQHFQSLAFFSPPPIQKYLRNIPESFSFSKGFSGGLLGGIFSFFKLFSRKYLEGWRTESLKLNSTKNSVFSNEKLLQRRWWKIIFSGAQKRGWAEKKMNEEGKFALRFPDSWPDPKWMMGFHGQKFLG